MQTLTPQQTFREEVGLLALRAVITIAGRKIRLDSENAEQELAQAIKDAKLKKEVNHL